jgi:hypothetical protein
MVIDDNTIIYPKQIDNVFIIQVTDEECRNANYYNSSVASNLKPIVAWDRALYYFNTQVDSFYTYKNVWFLEDDVFLMSEDVLIKIDEKYPESDLLTAFHDVNESGDAQIGWEHWVNVIHHIEPPWAHSLISASRLSFVILALVHRYVKDRPLMFIEALFSTIAHHRNSIPDQQLIHHPDELKDTITYDKKWDRDQVDITKLYHPFKKMEDHEYIRNKHKDLNI